jgi:hypothetical protein
MMARFTEVWVTTEKLKSAGNTLFTSHLIMKMTKMNGVQKPEN